MVSRTVEKYFERSELNGWPNPPLATSPKSNKKANRFNQLNLFKNKSMVITPIA
jgi:hypothetical protein